MKARILLFIILIIVVVAYAVFKFNEPWIIQELAPHFPESEENSPGYYADLVSFVFAEGVGLIILLIVAVYFSIHGKFLDYIRIIETQLLRNIKLTLAVAIVVFFGVTVLVATVSLEEFPNSADEFAYLFQAQQLSEGKFWDSVHPFPDFFEFHHLAQKDDKWVGRFPPGWPAVLSLAFILHIPPFLINALVGVLSLVVLFNLTKRVYDERIAMWATMIMGFSSFFIFNSATFFSHSISLLGALLFVLFAYRHVQAKKIQDALMAGVFLGLLVMTRQLTALLVFVPFSVYLFYKMNFRAALPLVFMGVGAFPFVVFFLWYNHSITGNALMPVTMWTNADEAIGFVKGHTPAQGVKFTVKRLLMFIYWASPSLLLLYMLYLIYRLKNFKKILIHPEDYLFLLLIVGYFFYYHSGGNQYGPRFYLEGFPFLVMFVTAKTLRSDRRWPKVFLFCGLIYSVVKIPFIANREHKVVTERKDVYEKVSAMEIKNAVVFISSPTGIIRPMPVEDLNRNDRYYKNDVIYARDLGADNRKLMEYYEDKNFYLYQRKFDEPSGELIKLNYSDFQQKR